MSGSKPVIAVVGGGPAGSLAATLLARGGAEVVLFERQRFPREKVCGECLSAVGIDVLRRSGLAGELEAVEPARLSRAVLVGPGGHEAVHALPRPMWGITRREMDTRLLSAAAAAGVRVVQPARVERVVSAGSARQVTYRDAENRLSTLEAWMVVLADGKGSFSACKPRPTGDLGVKLHLTGVAFDPGAIALFTLDGYYGGLAAVERRGGERLWNVALAVPEGRVRAVGGDLERIWAAALGRQGFLARTCGGAVRVGEILASPLPRFPVRADWLQGQIPVGNAAAALEPIGGEGMGLAMRSGELAAEAILEAMGRGGAVDVESLRRAYDRLWRVRRVACRGVAVAMSRPVVARGLVRLSERAAWGTRWVLERMGKTAASG